MNTILKKIYLFLAISMVIFSCRKITRLKTLFTGKEDPAAQQQGTASNPIAEIVIVTEGNSKSPEPLVTDIPPEVNGVTLSYQNYFHHLDQTPPLYWSAAKPGTHQISFYQLAIGTTPGGLQVLPWTSVGNTLTYQKTGLSLIHGTSYYVSLRAVDEKGLVSETVTASHPWTVDSIAPDMSGVSLSHQQQSASLTESPLVTWNSAQENLSGLGHYEIALGTSALGSEVIPWTNIGTVTQWQKAGLNLSENQNYFFSLKAIDQAGNISSVVSSSQPWIVDHTPPQMQAVSVTHVAYTAWTDKSPVISWNTAVDTQTNVAYYELALGTTPGGSQLLAWQNQGTQTTKQVTGLSLSSGTTYYASLRATDATGNVSVTVSSSGWTVDTQGPNVTSVTLSHSGKTYHPSNSPLLSWSPAATDALSGVHHYELALGSSAGASDLVAWQNVGSASSYTFSGLNLQEGNNYYPSLKALDGVGNSSALVQGSAWVYQVPPAPTGFNDMNFGSTTESPLMTWVAPAVTPLALDGYELALGSTSGATNIQGWTDVGNNLQGTLSSLSLTDTQNYYTSLRARYSGNSYSNPVTADGWRAVNPWKASLTGDLPTGPVVDVAVQTDNKKVMGGIFTGVAQHEQILPFTGRLNADGNRDNSFNTGAGFNAYVGSIAIQSDGKILVGGSFTTYQGVTQNRIIRLNTDGSKDISFDINTGFNDVVNTIVIQNDGKILVGGQFTTYQGVTKNRIIRLNSDGSIDTSFITDTGFNGYIYFITLQSDGKILVGGDFTTYKDVTQNYIIRLNIDGSKDNSFNIGTGFNNGIRSMAIQNDGKILTGGNFTSYNGVTQNRITRLNSDGSRDNSFNIATGFNGSIYTIAIQNDGKILTGGQFTTYKGVAQCNITRLNSDGSRDTSFNIATGFDGSIYTIAIQNDGKIIVGGYFSSYQGVTQNYLARLNNDGSRDNSLTIGIGFNNSVDFIVLQNDGKIIIGGRFTTYQGVMQNRITRLNIDSSRDNTFNVGTGFNNDVYSIAVQSDGKILVGGYFTSYNGNSQSHITRLNSDGTRDTSFNIGTGFHVNNDYVTKIAVQSDGKIVVGGRLSIYNGIAQKNLLRLNNDGSRDSSFNVGTGVFTFADIRDIVIQPDGKIIIGGFIVSYNDVPQNGITRINNDGNLDNSFNSGTGFNNDVTSIAIQSDGKIIIGGVFTSYNSVTQNRIARLNSNGSLDTSFNSGTGFNGGVSSIAIQSDGKLIASGDFTSYNSVTKNQLIRLNFDGTRDNTFSLGEVSGFDQRPSIRLQADGKILVWGFFILFNNQFLPYSTLLSW